MRFNGEVEWPPRSVSSAPRAQTVSRRVTYPQPVLRTHPPTLHGLLQRLLGGSSKSELVSNT
jgi:hypothetical protein